MFRLTAPQSSFSFWSERRHSPSKIVRIVQALGFGSYKDFQHYLHDLSVTSATVLDGMQAACNTAQPAT
jgi:DNA-binding MurR/RpiR family transcriptional regulator